MAPSQPLGREYIFQIHGFLYYETNTTNKARLGFVARKKNQAMTIYTHPSVRLPCGDLPSPVVVPPLLSHVHIVPRPALSVGALEQTCQVSWRHHPTLPFALRSGHVQLPHEYPGGLVTVNGNQE
jgi:hypothetical protein